MTVIIARKPISNKIASSQERLEAIFHTVDTIKADLNKCGMRLQEARQFSGITPFTSTPSGFTCLYGIADEPLLEKAVSGQQTLKVAANEFFKRDKQILIYDPIQQAWEMNEIESSQDGALVLKDPLQNDYLTDSMAVVLKTIEFKFYPGQRVLKRKTDKGSFQPLLEEVSDFYVTYFPDAQSVLYRIEVNKKEQIRGYIFLLNLV
jgi:hypothetical protein